MKPAILVTRREVCDILRVSLTRLDTMRNNPAFPAPVTISQRPLKWRLKDIEHYIEEQ